MNAPPHSPNNKTIHELCTKLRKEQERRENAVHVVGSRKKRTVRSAIHTNDAQKPLVIKSQVDLPTSRQANGKNNNKRKHTSLDHIIQQLQRGKWPPDVVVLITPASKHNNLYKLHVIDRKNEDHLGMTSITQQELAELRDSNVFEKYPTIMGNKYIDLKTVTLNTAIIANIMKNLNGDCCQQQQQQQKPRAAQFPMTLAAKNHAALPSKELQSMPRQSSSDATEVAPKELAKPRRHADLKYARNTRRNQQYHTESGMRLMMLIERINDAIEPSPKDLHTFFQLAETYKFKIYIRPELCWKPPPQAAVASSKLCNKENDSDYVRFNIECFMLFDNYVGSITINSLQLHEQLKLHPLLLPRVEVIEDVCELTPLPKWLVMALRTIAEWLGLEMFYDGFGEFIFDLYKQVT